MAFFSAVAPTHPPEEPQHVDGQMMPTGSLPAVRTPLGLQTFPPQVAAVRQARRFTEAALASSTMAGVAELADDAGLLVSELAANAVLHARSDFDVAVSETHDGVRIAVRDRSDALPVLTAPSATAMSGRGLALVQTLAARWGAGASSADGAVKSVWFELAVTTEAEGAARAPGALGAVDPSVVELSVEELLASWSEDAPLPPTTTISAAAGGVHVVLPALNAPSLLAAKEGMDDVLRELQLVLLAPRRHAHAAPEELAVARRLDEAARDFDDVRRQVRDQVSRAVAAGRLLVELALDLPVGTAARAVAYRSAVHAAESLAADGVLLSTPESLRAHHAVREAYLGEVIAAAQQ